MSSHTPTDPAALPASPAAHPSGNRGPSAPRSWTTWLIGRPLPTADAPHQAIGKFVGLAVFASDALSSTAYATQEILAILALAGTAAFGFAFPIALAIVLLLTIVTISYEQTIHAYPGGGGAYIVARDNLGEHARADRRCGAADRLCPDRCRVDLVGGGAADFGVPPAISAARGLGRRAGGNDDGDQPARRARVRDASSLFPPTSSWR